MLSKLVEDLSEALHELFPHATYIVASINDSVIATNAFDDTHVAIPEEINEVLRKVASKFQMRTGDLAWKRQDNNLEVYIVPNVNGYTIKEAHWWKKDSHSDNDADSSYAVMDADGRIVEIFNTKEEAEHYKKYGRYINSNAVDLPDGLTTMGAGTVPTSNASTSKTKIEELVESFGAAPTYSSTKDTRKK